MDPKGNKFQYEYDNNIPTRILSGIADNGISYEMKYDTFGNHAYCNCHYHLYIFLYLCLVF